MNVLSVMGIACDGKVFLGFESFVGVDGVNTRIYDYRLVLPTVQKHHIKMIKK